MCLRVYLVKHAFIFLVKPLSQSPNGNCVREMPANKFWPSRREYDFLINQRYVIYLTFVGSSFGYLSKQKQMPNVFISVLFEQNIERV